MSHVHETLPPFSVWEHVQTGSLYVVIGVARCSTNGEREGKEYSVIYYSLTYQALCYREVSEFLDGRFERVQGKRDDRNEQIHEILNRSVQNAKELGKDLKQMFTMPGARPEAPTGTSEAWSAAAERAVERTKKRLNLRCSFCLKPRREVGKLIAPSSDKTLAAPMICDECVEACSQTLGTLNLDQEEAAQLRCIDRTVRYLFDHRDSQEAWSALEKALFDPKAAIIESDYISASEAAKAAQCSNHNWQTFGPGGPLATPATVCIKCGLISSEKSEQETR